MTSYRDKAFLCTLKLSNSKKLNLLVSRGSSGPLKRKKNNLLKILDFPSAVLINITITFCWGWVHTSPAEFKNAVLFIRLDLPSTLICHGNGAFPAKAVFKPEKFEKASFSFSCRRKAFENAGTFVDFPNLVCSNTNRSVLNSGVVRTENTWCFFTAKPSFSNFSGVMDGNWGSGTNCGRFHT